MEMHARQTTFDVYTICGSKDSCAIAAQSNSDYGETYEIHVRSMEKEEIRGNQDFLVEVSAGQKWDYSFKQEDLWSDEDKTVYLSDAIMVFAPVSEF